MGACCAKLFGPAPKKKQGLQQPLLVGPASGAALPLQPPAPVTTGEHLPADEAVKDSLPELPPASTSPQLSSEEGAPHTPVSEQQQLPKSPSPVPTSAAEEPLLSGTSRLSAAAPVFNPAKLLPTGGDGDFLELATDPPSAAAWFAGDEAKAQEAVPKQEQEQEETALLQSPKESPKDSPKDASTPAAAEQLLPVDQPAPVVADLPSPIRQSSAGSGKATELEAVVSAQEEEELVALAPVEKVEGPGAVVAADLAALEEGASADAAEVVLEDKAAGAVADQAPSGSSGSAPGPQEQQASAEASKAAAAGGGGGRGGSRGRKRNKGKGGRGGKR